jgi:Uma2 family endonuclease
MARDLTHKVQYYYDSHPTEEDLMGETSWHASLIDYLKAVLTWLFRGQTCAIYDNLNFYQTTNTMEYPVAPDLAVIKGVEFRHGKSWAVGRTGPAPQVVFEILSEETWKKDLREKPDKYASMGVQEYFAYDPNEPPLRRNTSIRLRGWRLDARRKEMVEIIANEAGWLWSEHLESWLVPDQIYLRLYDREHKMRLTGEEAEARRAEDAVELAEEAHERAEDAFKQAEMATKQAEEATKQAEEATKHAQVLADKLRSLGINPDEL